VGSDPAPEGPWRVFIAIDPSDEARRALTDLTARLRVACEAAGVKARWARPDTFHLTLRFLGDVSPERAAEIGRALAPIGSTDRLEIALGALGAFPDEKNPRVLWIAPVRGGGALKSLAEQVDRCLGGLGIPPEDRQFRAHLTLARVKRAGKSLSTVLEKVSPAGEIASPISEVVLYRSDLLPRGALHTVVARVPLRGD
jgi:2'-5' RNA ligase